MQKLFTFAGILYTLITAITIMNPLQAPFILQLLICSMFGVSGWLCLSFGLMKGIKDEAQRI